MTLADDLADIIDGAAPSQAAYVQALAVLDSPEMTSLRQGMIHAAWNAAVRAYPASPGGVGLLRTYFENNCNIDSSVIEWLLEGRE